MLSRSSEDASPPALEFDSTQRLISTHPGETFSAEPEGQNMDNKVSHNLQTGATYKQGNTASRYPGETQNPYSFSQPQQVGGFGKALSMSPDENTFSQVSGGGRGESLVDQGSTSGDGVRRLARPGARRPSSTAQSAAERYSRASNSHAAQSPATSLAMRLPPGAAPPQPGKSSNY